MRKIVTNLMRLSHLAGDVGDFPTAGDLVDLAGKLQKRADGIRLSRDKAR